METIISQARRLRHMAFSGVFCAYLHFFCLCYKMKTNEVIGMYMTAQRKRLFQFFNDHPDASFSARDIQALLNRSEASAISLSAVYRNLASLTEAGLILKSAASDGQETLYRFVGADACRDELHMTCLSCGQTTHVDHATARALAQALAGNDEFQMNLGQTTIYGLCKKCREK